jgi:hypothetical protein
MDGLTDDLDQLEQRVDHLEDRARYGALAPIVRAARSLAP